MDHHYYWLCCCCYVSTYLLIEFTEFSKLMVLCEVADWCGGRQSVSFVQRVKNSDTCLPSVVGSSVEKAGAINIHSTCRFSAGR